MKEPKKLANTPNERNFKHIIIHSSATMQGLFVDATDIDMMHREKGWTGIGYNFVVTPDGNVEIGRSMTMAGAHCRAKGRNNDSIGICYVGGVDCEKEPADTRTREQKIALEALLQGLKAVWPEAQISGHRAWALTECPSFDAGRAYRHITGEPLLKSTE
jgi:N-acetylmuramoyl-L-alanine amidase